MKRNKKGLFVIGAEPGAGSTTVTAALARLCAERGIATGVMVPVSTGVADPAQPSTTAKLLQWAAAGQIEEQKLNPYRFTANLDPASAASQQKQRIDYHHLLQTSTSIINEHDFTLIDGGPGLMVPLAGGLLMADFVVALDLPLLVITRPSGDAVNRTLMTLFCATQMNIPMAGYLINQMPTLKTIAEELLPHTLAVMTGQELVGVLDCVSGQAQERVTALATRIQSMRTFSLLTPYLP